MLNHLTPWGAEREDYDLSPTTIASGGGHLLTNFRRTFIWAVRTLPFLVIAGLLVPGDAWIAQEIRTFAGLITVLILPAIG